MEERRGRRTRSWSSAEKWINICLCDEILRLWPLTPRLIWFQQQSTSLKLLSNQKWMALNWGVLWSPLPAKKYQINVYVFKVRWWMAMTNKLWKFEKLRKLRGFNFGYHIDPKNTIFSLFRAKRTGYSWMVVLQSELHWSQISVYSEVAWWWSSNAVSNFWLDS